MKLPSIKFGSKGICTYCGDEAQTVDHCIPVSSQTFQKRRGGMRFYGPQTPACSDCNGKLSNRVFDTFYERCSYVSEKWKNEIKPVHWNQKEINQLSGWLRNYVAADMNRRLWVFNRADWMDTRDFWLNIENLTWDHRLKVGSNIFHQGLFDYFKSTLALAELVYSERLRK